MKKFLSIILILSISVVTLSLTTVTNAATATSTAGVVSTSSTSLNIRSSNSTNSPIIASLKKGSYVTLISKSGSWWYVEYEKNKYGYCHSDFIKQITSSTSIVNIQSGSLNVRSGAGTSYTIIGKLLKGENVIVLSSSSNWSKILYNGTKIGYVSSQYLSSNNYKAISLNLPNFKQTDSRWANVKIANSGKTIAQIGCTTTAIAMMESYRTGKTIFPDAMSKKLSYSSSGDLYWPSDYQVVLNSSGYLKSFYDILKQGKPILFGAKNSYGKQHWVVITGYTGGESLSASKFTVNDPGSNSRTNLQQFLNAYPNFYKYFYYK